jgi:hypothetical protein
MAIKMAIELEIHGVDKTGNPDEAVRGLFINELGFCSRRIRLGIEMLAGRHVIRVQRRQPRLVILWLSGIPSAVLGRGHVIVSTMGLKPSPSGESFRFIYWRHGELPQWGS